MIVFVGDIQEKSVDDYLVRVATTLRDACRELTPSTTAASDLDSMKRKRIENAEAIRSAVEQEHKLGFGEESVIEDGARKKLNVYSRSKRRKKRKDDWRRNALTKRRSQTPGSGVSSTRRKRIRAGNGGKRKGRGFGVARWSKRRRKGRRFPSSWKKANSLTREF